MSLDSNYTYFTPLTLDGLSTIQANSLNLNVDEGVLQSDSLGDIYSSDTIICSTFQPRNNYINFSTNEPHILGVTLTNFIRNSITGSSSINFDKNNGIISLSGGLESKWNLNITQNTIYPAVATTGNVAINNLIVSGNATMNNNLYVIGGIKSTGGLNVTGNITFNNNLYVSAGIGVGEQPLGGVHRLNTKGRIRANAYSAVDSAGVIETVSNGGYINYLYTSDTGKAYYDGSTSNLNVLIALSANNGLQVDGSSVHNSGIYVVGGSEINGGLKIQGGLNVTLASSFNNNLNILGELRGNQGLFITGLGGQSSKFYSGGLNVTGSSSFNNDVTITGGSLNVIGISSLGDLLLARNNNSTGRLITISFGTANAGVQSQGIEWRDLTTPVSNLGIYGGQNTMRFYAGASEKMSIGSNVNFSAMPLLNSNPITTDNIGEGTTNLYWTQTRFNTAFSAKTTDNLTEGSTNKYFSNTLARQAISAVSPIAYNNSSGVISLASGNTTTEWKQSSRYTNGNNYFLLATMRYDSSSDGGMAIKGIIGGYENNVNSMFDLVINTRGSASTSPTGAYITGSIQTSTASLATIIGRADIAVYLDSTASPAGVYNIYLVTKNNAFFSYDIFCSGTAGGVTLQNPTNTGILTPVGTLTMASVLSSLQTYSIAGNLALGWSGGTSSKLLVSGNASVQGLFVRSSSVASLGTDLYLNSGGVNDSIYIRPNGNGSTVGQSLFQPTATSLQSDALFINSVGNLGIGNTNPNYKLSISANTDTTVHIKNNSTTGYSQLYLQCDGIAGGGLYLNGSNGLAYGGLNGLVLENTIGNVNIRSPVGNQINMGNSIALSGNVNIGRSDNSTFESSLLVAGGDYRTLTTLGGVHMGYSANGFGASIGLISTATGNCQIEFGARNDAGIADGYIRWNNSSDQIDIGADVITFKTNVTVPHTERARFLADGRFIINSNTAISSYAGNVLQTKGRICIGQYDSSDTNPVIEMIDSGGNSRYFYHSGTSGFYMTSRLGLSIVPAYQLQLSTDSAGKPTSNGWTIVSDRRLKEDIEDANLDICYENMKRLKLKRFKYKDDWMSDEDGNRKSQDTHFLGFIAQEVKEIFPKAITIIDDTENTGIDDLHTLDTDQLLKSSYGALQKLIKKVENLEETIIKERIEYKLMKQKQDSLITKQGILIDSMKKALLLRGISIN